MELCIHSAGCDSGPGDRLGSVRIALELHEGDHSLAESDVGQADHDGIAHVRVVLQRRLHLVGEDLLAPRC